MLVTAILVLVTGGAAIPAQETSERFRGLSLPEALRILQADGLHVIYSSSLVRAQMRVAEEPVGRWPREVLDEILAPHGLEARPGPGGVLLIVRAPPRGAIEGIVAEAGGSPPLPGVRIVVESLGADATTDSHGRFSLGSVPMGTYSVAARLDGYRPAKAENVTVVPGGVTKVRFELAPSTISVEEVVRANDPAAGRNRPAMRQSLSREDVERSPEFSHDPLQGVGRLTGVAFNEASGNMNVRGGARDEVMIVLDGLELYEPYHLKDRGGLLSIIDSRVVGGMGFLGGAFPAEYGGRMSGVIEIDSVTQPDELSHGIGVSSNDLRLASQGLFAGASGEWLFSGRRGDPSRILDALEADPRYDPSYYDVFGRVGYALSDTADLSFSLLASRDEFEGVDGAAVNTLEESGSFRSIYANNSAWLNLRKRWNPRLYSQSILSRVGLSDEREGSSANLLEVFDRRSAYVLGLKQDWLIRSDRHLWKWGVDLKQLSGEYRYRSLAAPAGPDVSAGTLVTVPPEEIGLDPSGGDYGLYIADRIHVLPTLEVELGLRWDLQTYTVESDSTFSPRVSLVRAVGSRSRLRAGWGYFHQPERIHELQVQDGVERFARPQRAEHRVIGFEHELEKGYRFQVGAYQKIWTDLRVRYENLFDPFSFFPEAGADRVAIAPDRAEARGVELAVWSPPGKKLSWWAGYGLSSAEDEIDGEWIPRSWDQKHTVNLGLNLRPWDRWDLTVAGAYHSGRPTTPVTAEAQMLPDGSLGIIPIIGPRNSERFPSYHRLDLRISRSMDVKGTVLKAFLNVANLLDRDNVCCVESFDYHLAPDGTVAVEREDRHGLRRVFTFGLSWTF
jgi:outer membrane receptor protein involved in Fe transport